METNTDFKLITKTFTEKLPQTIEGIAYHEAGHALLCYKFGIPIRRIKVWKQRGFVHAPLDFPTSNFSKEILEHSDKSIRTLNRTRLSRRLKIYAMINLAGIIAQLKYIGKPMSYNSDFFVDDENLSPDLENITTEMAVANSLLPQDRYDELSTTFWQSETRIFVAKNKSWKAITAVANALIENETHEFSGKEAEAILAKHIATSTSPYSSLLPVTNLYELNNAA